MGPTHYGMEDLEMKALITDGDATTCADARAALNTRHGQHMTLTVNYYPNDSHCRYNVAVNVIIQADGRMLHQLFRDVVSVLSTTELHQLAPSYSDIITYVQCVRETVNVLSDDTAEQRYNCRCETACSVEVVLDNSIRYKDSFYLCEVNVTP